MPLCPQIINTPITVSLTADFTVTNVVPVVPATTENVADVVVLIDGKTKAYYQATAPTTGMTEGDIWFDTDDGYKLYYYTGSAWTSVQDTSIAAAQAAATAAQTTANGKNKIYRQGTSPGTTGNAVGDTWFNTSADNAISRWDGTSWVATTLGNNALASISANKITAGTIDASVITVSNLDAGNISTGTLAAARIAANSIDASKIVAGSITATQISSSYVYAGTIAAGNITAGTLSATVALNAVSGTIAGFTLTSSTITNGSTMTLYNNGDFYTGGVVSSQGGLYSTAACFLGSTLNVTGQLNANGELYASQAVTNSVTAATNCYITTGGLIRRTSNVSSMRFKENITNISNVSELDPKKLLDLPVVAFTYKQGHIPDSDDRANQMLPGFIAEDVDALYPIAADYEAGNVETWNSFYIVPAMLALIQDLHKEIQILKGE